MVLFFDNMTCSHFVDKGVSERFLRPHLLKKA